MSAVVRWAIGVVLVVATAGAVMLGTAIGDTQQVRTRAELAEVQLGVPWNWIEQDQASMDPPLRQGPFEAQFISPTDNPPDVLLGPALADLAVFSLVIGAVVLAGRAVVLGGRRRLASGSTAPDDSH